MISFAFLAIPDPVELRETVDDIVRDDRRTGDLIQHLRLMLSKGDGNRERFQVYDIIEEVLAITGAELETLGISVEQELAPNLPAVEAPTAASTRA
jgi:C4-dicarboxylate-specific signal transduction histidine kinase